MNWHDLLNAIALLFIFEGILPFASPSSIKDIYKTVIETPESRLRMIGLASIVAGLVLLYIV